MQKSTCPLCGKKYPVSKWCECGYQEESVKEVENGFEDYLRSMTVKELKDLASSSQIKIQRWQNKDEIIWMLSSPNFKKRLGFPDDKPYL